MKNKLTKSEEKLLNFLNDLYERTSTNPCQLSLAKHCKENKMNSSLASVLVQNKLISVNKTYRIYIYTWNTIKPNINMVRRIDEILKQINRKHNALRLEKARIEKEEKISKIINVPVPVKVEVETQTETKTVVKEKKQFSLLWGLIKFKW
jgi:hypothetical protein